MCIPTPTPCPFPDLIPSNPLSTAIRVVLTTTTLLPYNMHLRLRILPISSNPSSPSLRSRISGNYKPETTSLALSSSFTGHFPFQFLDAKVPTSLALILHPYTPSSYFSLPMPQGAQTTVVCRRWYVLSFFFSWLTNILLVSDRCCPSPTTNRYLPSYPHIYRPATTSPLFTISRLHLLSRLPYYQV